MDHHRIRKPSYSSSHKSISENCARKG
jgi:hypothetical protein